jgi:putative transposase
MRLRQRPGWLGTSAASPQYTSRQGGWGRPGTDAQHWSALVGEPQPNFRCVSLSFRLITLGSMSAAKRSHRRNFNEPGHAHVLTFSCYRSYKLLAADRTCQWLAEAIDAARGELDFALWAYVFMPEHAHLIVWPRQPVYDIVDIRRAIKSPAARKAIRYLTERAPEWLPRISRTRGQKTERLFWQSGGGYDRNIVEPATLLREIDYVHLNPVRRGLVERADQWKWSSESSFNGAEAQPLAVDRIPAEWMT